MTSASTSSTYIPIVNPTLSPHLQAKLDKYYELFFGNQLTMTDIWLWYMLNPWFFFVVVIVFGVWMFSRNIYYNVQIQRHILLEKSMADSLARIADSLEKNARSTRETSLDSIEIKKEEKLDSWSIA